MILICSDYKNIVYSCTYVKGYLVVLNKYYLINHTENVLFCHFKFISIII